MEPLVIKMVSNIEGAAYASKRDIANLIVYILSEKNTHACVRHWNVRGLPKHPKSIVCAIEHVQHFYKNTNGRRMWHFIISFPSRIKNVEMVCKSAQLIADEIFFSGHQVLYGIHEDTDNLHIHFAFNAVNFFTGNKFHQTIRENTIWKNTLLNLVNSTLPAESPPLTLNSNKEEGREYPAL